MQAKVEQQTAEAPGATHPRDVGPVAFKETNGIPRLTLEVAVSTLTATLNPEARLSAFPPGTRGISFL